MRARRREQGDRQVTVFLDAQNAELLSQMTAFSKRSQSELLNDALEGLARSYSYWGVARPSDYYGDDGWDSSYEDQDTPRRRVDVVPPWIVQLERLDAARQADFERRFPHLEDDDGLDVYRKGIDRNLLRR